jgi:hypothetical protein
MLMNCRLMKWEPPKSWLQRKVAPRWAPIDVGNHDKIHKCVLGFMVKGALVISSADKHRRGQELPRLGPSVGGNDLLLLVWFQLTIMMITSGLDVYGGVDAVLSRADCISCERVSRRALLAFT